MWLALAPTLALPLTRFAKLLGVGVTHLTYEQLQRDSEGRVRTNPNPNPNPNPNL